MTAPAQRNGAFADPTAIPPVSAAPLLPVVEQLEMYARDVQALHAQRMTLAEELRRVQRRLAAAQQEQAELKNRLEAEFEREQALEAERQRWAAAATRAVSVKVRDDGRAVAIGLLGGLVVALVLGAVAAMVAFQGGIFGGGATPPAPTPEPRITTPTATGPAPVVVSSGPVAVPSGLSAAAPASAAPTPAAASRCATDLSVPALAPNAAYVVRIKQERDDDLTVLWPQAQGRIALAAVGSNAPNLRTPAVVPLGQLPPQLAQAAASAELTTSAPAGYVFAALVNPTDQRLLPSHGVAFYAGDAACA